MLGRVPVPQPGVLVPVGFSKDGHGWAGQGEQQVGPGWHCCHVSSLWTGVVSPHVLSLAIESSDWQLSVFD